MVKHYTDYEATQIYLTAVFRYNLAAPSYELRRELADCPWLSEGDNAVAKRHSPGSIAMRWTDFRTAVNPDLTPTRGAHLPQVRRIIKDLEYVTGLSLREDLFQAA